MKDYGPNDKLNGYDLSRKWFDFAFENTDKINPNHVALYFFMIEHCNRLGWVKKFGFPMEMAKNAIGIRNYRTYSKTFSDLVEWGFVEVIEKSKNQYTANIIALTNNAITTKRALDNAIVKNAKAKSVAMQKQYNGTVGINKPSTNKQKTKKSIDDRKAVFKKTLHPFLAEYGKGFLNDFFSYWTEKNPRGLKMRFEKEKTFDVARRLGTWKANNEKWAKQRPGANAKPTMANGVEEKLNNM